MSKPKRLEKLASLAYAVMGLAYKHNASRFFDEMQRTTERDERAHRASGRRVCGAYYYRSSVQDSVNYFTCKCVLEPVESPKGWADFCSLRHDYASGQAVREMLKRLCPDELADLEVRWRELAIDYRDDIAGAK